MAQHLTLLERSAMSMRMKRQAKNQEVVRIMRNTKESESRDAEPVFVKDEG